MQHRIGYVDWLAGGLTGGGGGDKGVGVGLFGRPDPWQSVTNSSTVRVTVVLPSNNSCFSQSQLACQDALASCILHFLFSALQHPLHLLEVHVN